MKHVLLTADAIGGVWTYCVDLARGLSERGVRVSLAVLGPAPSGPQREAAQRVAQVVTTGLALEWTAQDADEVRSVGAILAGLAARLRVDAVHLHTPALAADTAWSVPVVAVAHSDVGTWWQATRTGPMPPDIAWRAAMVAHGLAEADAVIAPSHAFCDALQRLYRPGRAIAVVHNGAASHATLEFVREPRVLAAGRLWDEGKNLALLDRTAPLLEHPVVAAGPLQGPGEAATFANLSTPGLLTPEALRTLMAQSSVFASCARYEPFGLAVLEAARSGMALALSDIPTHRELWDGAALFFHPDDAGGLADVLRRLLRAPESAAARAAERATRYTLEAMVAGTLAVHGEVRQRRAA